MHALASARHWFHARHGFERQPGSEAVHRLLCDGRLCLAVLGIGILGLLIALSVWTGLRAAYDPLRPLYPATNPYGTWPLWGTWPFALHP